MRFEPATAAKAEEQAKAASGLWKPGIYDFEVSEASEGQSKAGNGMFTVQIDIYDHEGKRKTIFDYLMPDNEFFGFKVRHFAESIGMLKEYDSGALDANDLFNRTGKCKVGIQKGKDGYNDKNVIRDYLKSSSNGTAPKEVAARAQAPLDDEIPFSQPLAA